MRIRREWRNDTAIYSAGPWPRRLRLAAGTILFVYVTLHLIDHALGNIGLGAMQAMLMVQLWLWQGAIGSLLLYGAFLVHGGLGLAAFYQRRFHRSTWSEWTQLVLGLAIPALLANHLADTRLALLLYGIPKQYPQVLATFWVFVPLFGVLQVVVLIVAWTHGCIGMHTAFRLKRWYGRVNRLLLVLAVLLPVLALLGFATAAREVARDVLVPAWRAVQLAPARTGTPQEAAHLFYVRDICIGAWLSLLAFVLALRGLRTWREAGMQGIAITYPDGRIAEVPPGFSVLEASRRIGFPHAAVCGGRGRCSTCRIRVLGAAAPLAPPAATEAAVLARVGADPQRIRLACQLRPRAAIGVCPLIPPEIARSFVVGSGGGKLGEERFIVAMFVDLRDSTALIKDHLPYDAVFLLGRFVEAAAAAVLAAGGVPNQFTGDGMLALFGLYASPPEACRAALGAAGRIAAALEKASGTLANADRPFGFGIGAHCGMAVVGEIGFGHGRTFTALGEVVHLAQRLERVARDSRHAAVISAEIFDRAGFVSSTAAARDIVPRGYDRALPVYLLSAASLAQEFAGQ